jgi:hypothetical protein
VNSRKNERSRTFLEALTATLAMVAAITFYVWEIYFWLVREGKKLRCPKRLRIKMFIIIIDAKNKENKGSTFDPFVYY